MNCPGSVASSSSFWGQMRHHQQGSRGHQCHHLARLHLVADQLRPADTVHVIQSTLPEDSSITVSTIDTHIHIHKLVVGIHHGQYDDGVKAFVVVEQTARVKWSLHPHMLAIYRAIAVMEVPLVLVALGYLPSLLFCCGTLEGCLVVVVIDGTPLAQH